MVPFHIPTTKMARHLYYRNKPKIVHHRGILVSLMLQAFVNFCVAIFPKILQDIFSAYT